jgi:hypothetical protein
LASTSAIMTTKHRYLDSTAGPKHLVVPREETSICTSCRSFLERPHATRCTKGCPPEYNLTSTSRNCRFCQRLHYQFWSSVEPGVTSVVFALKIWFLDDPLQPNPSTPETPCLLYIDKYASKPEEDLIEEHRSWSVSPVRTNKKLRRDFVSEPIVYPLITRSTRDLRTLEIVKHWMTECSLHHNSCSTSIRSRDHSKVYLPARLISVNKQDRLRLVVPDRARPPHHYRYATLTHRWGKGKGLLLSRKNKDELHTRITLLSLPRTFRDAIRVCRILDISYLWIDTLCIMQDDYRERAREISNMGHIYENAYLNIGAQAAAEMVESESKVGLFVNRSDFGLNRSDSACYNEPICTRVQRKDFDELCYMVAPDHSVDLNDAALMSRGWVLQERILSPRSIYFGKELVWECSEHIASESCPNGVFRPDVPWPLPYIWGLVLPLRLKTLVFGSRYIADQSNPRRNGRWSSKYECWMRIVEIFSHCNLTYDSDCLLALSGLAKYFAQEFDDDYLAGMWRKDLFHQLLWHRAVDPLLPENRCNSPQEYRGE